MRRCSRCSTRSFPSRTSIGCRWLTSGAARANQPLVPLSERGRERYAAHVDAAVDGGGKRMQMAVEGGRVWMIGIPARGDMARVETLCASAASRLTKVSWRR